MHAIHLVSHIHTCAKVASVCAGTRVVERMKREHTEGGGKKEKCVRKRERHKESETEIEREAAVISMMFRVTAIRCTILRQPATERQP